MKALLALGLLLAGCASLEDKCLERASAKPEQLQDSYFNACMASGVARQQALSKALGSIGQSNSTHCTTQRLGNTYNTDCN